MYVLVAHAGTIEVTSSELDGTVFTASLPRAGPPPANQDARQRA